MSEQIQKHTFELVGPREGFTGQLGPARSPKKYRFVEGVFTIVGSATGVAGVKKVLADHYNAHMPGSPEHTRALSVWGQNPKNPKGTDNGNSNVQSPAPSRQANAVSGNVQPVGAGAQTPAANDVKTGDNPKVSGVAPTTPPKS